MGIFVAAYQTTYSFALAPARYLLSEFLKLLLDFQNGVGRFYVQKDCSLDPLDSDIHRLQQAERPGQLSAKPGCSVSVCSKFRVKERLIPCRQIARKQQQDSNVPL